MFYHCNIIILNYVIFCPQKCYALAVIIADVNTAFTPWQIVCIFPIQSLLRLYEIGTIILSILRDEGTIDFLVAQLVKNPPAVWETWVRSMGWEDALGEGKGSPFQDSGMENSTDCIVLGVAKSQTDMN